MQSSQVEQDSPYLLWQYVNLLTPAKPEYPVHPAFTHPSAGQQMSYLHEHSLNSYLHEQNLNGYHPHPSHPTPSHVHRVSPLANFKLNNETHCKRTAHATKRSFKTRTDRHIIVSTEQSKLTTHAQSNNSTSSPIKGSSFTIDAILKNDRNKPSKSTSSPTNTTSSCPVPESCYSPNTPTTHGYFYGQPLLHSTPTMDTPDRRHSRVHDLSHPYLYPQFDAHPTFHASPHVLPLTPLASSSSSLSGSSSPSTSPESHALHRAEKAERKCPGKPKRIRTIFTQEQLEKLEAEFERQQYMVGTERYYLAATLNLTEAQVKVWFQNRRIKWRKQHLELQHARLAQCDLYKDLDEETDDTDTEDKHGSDVRRPDIHTDTSNGEASFSS